jgi:hypothetical protein
VTISRLCGWLARPATARQASPDNSRFERKFLVDQLNVHQMRALIRSHPALFVVTYPARYVNNIYLDDWFLRSFHDNVSGIGERLKARVRWYGDFFGPIDQPVLELKMKRGLVGRKHQFPLPATMVMDRRFCWATMRALFRSIALPEQVRMRLGDANPLLLNRYRRFYYATVDGRFRLTLDCELTFYHAGRSGNSFLHKQVDYRQVVLELKYAPEHDDQAHRITSAFPFRLSRSSKYVQGIDRVAY